MPMPPPKLKKADVENKKLFKSGSTVIWVERDPTGPAYNASHKVKATSAAGCLWRGTVTGHHSGELWKAVVTFQAGSCSAVAAVEKDEPEGGPRGTEDIAVTVTNPGGENSNTEIAVQVEIVP
jgi:hypothetical protein